MKKFCGRFQNKRGDQLIITEISEEEAICDFISGLTNKPIIRPYFENKLSVEMRVEFDYYGSGIEIDLGAELTYCLEDLDYPFFKALNLSVGISRPQGDKFAYLDDYTSLFGLESYKRIESE